MLVSIDVLDGLFDCLFRKNNTQAVDSLFGSYFNEKQDSINTCYVYNLYFFWFVLACQRKAAHPTLIQELYNHIYFDKIEYDCDTVDDVDRFFTFYEENKKSVFDTVTEMKDQLIKRKGGKNKLKKLANLFAKIRNKYVSYHYNKHLSIKNEYEKIMKAIFEKESFSSEEHSK